MALVLSLIGIAAPSLRSEAQQYPLEVVVENDAMVSWIPGRSPSDREYTHGMWIALDRNDATLLHHLLPGLLPCDAVPSGDLRCKATRLEAGQKIFTPGIREPIPPPNERPYAGWLYAAVTGRITDPGTARSLRLEMGVTGPPSMGEQFQRIVHRITRYDDPKGWDHQLAFEPGLLLRYGERRIVDSRSSAGGNRVADVIASGDLEVGNVRAGAAGRLTVRAGNRMPHPWQPSAAVDRPVVFGFGQVERRWAAHDLFLDGNTFRESARVERRPFTGSIEVGIAVQYRRVKVTYSVVREERLYTTQPYPHLYSSASLSFDP